MPLGYLEDRLAINDLFVRYTTALDRGDVETLVDCFMPDGSLDSPAVGRHAGHAAIRAFAERFARFHERGAQLRHVISKPGGRDRRQSGAGDLLSAQRADPQRPKRVARAGPVRMRAGPN